MFSTAKLAVKILVNTRFYINGNKWKTEGLMQAGPLVGGLFRGLFTDCRRSSDPLSHHQCQKDLKEPDKKAQRRPDDLYKAEFPGQYPV
jgi:hypothetical protein